MAVAGFGATLVSVRVLAALILPVAVLLPVAYVGHRLSGQDLPLPQRPTAIVWGDRVFTTRADLASWLRARGVRYETWARRHPALARPRVARPVPDTPDRARAAAPAGDDGNGNVRLLVGGLLALASGSVLAVLVRRRRSTPRRRLPPAPLARRRGGRSFAGALAVLREAPRQVAFAVDHLRRQDDFAWYLAASLFAVAVGALLPYSLR